MRDLRSCDLWLSYDDDDDDVDDDDDLYISKTVNLAMIR